MIAMDLPGSFCEYFTLYERSSITDMLPLLGNDLKAIETLTERARPTEARVRLKIDTLEATGRERRSGQNGFPPSSREREREREGEGENGERILLTVRINGQVRNSLRIHFQLTLLREQN